MPLTPPVRVLYVLLKIARGNTHLGDDLLAWADELIAILANPGGEELFMALVNYISCVADTPAEDLGNLFEQLGPKAKEAYMTTADMLRAEGRTQGHAEGRTETVLKLLNAKFGPLPDSTLAKVRQATAEQLDDWALRILDARSLADVMR